LIAPVNEHLSEEYLIENSLTQRYNLEIAHEDDNSIEMHEDSASSRLHDVNNWSLPSLALVSQGLNATTKNIWPARSINKKYFIGIQMWLNKFQSRAGACELWPLLGNISNSLISISTCMRRVENLTATLLSPCTTDDKDYTVASIHDLVFQALASQDVMSNINIYPEKSVIAEEFWTTRRTVDIHKMIRAASVRTSVGTLYFVDLTLFTA
jgi:hypothetical protein